MIWGIKEGKRILANPLIKNITCPMCGFEVIAKCGKIKVWHFAHKSNKECDDWKNPESEWHLKWKCSFFGDWQEVIIEKNGKKHIADIKHPDSDIVIEFQNSSISPEDISKREEFYGKMIWVINGETIAKNLDLRYQGNYTSFRWKWPPKSWEYAKKPLYIDIGIGPTPDGLMTERLLLIKKIHFGRYVGGWGKIVTKQNFVRGVYDGYYGY